MQMKEAVMCGVVSVQLELLDLGTLFKDKQNI